MSRSRAPLPGQLSLFDRHAWPTVAINWNLDLSVLRPVMQLVPRRLRGSPGPGKSERAGRDAALNLMATTRGPLIEVAREIALDIAHRVGRVTSVEVFAHLRAQGYGEYVDAVDARWMGVIFQKGWHRLGSERTGSHMRRVSIWTLHR